ncbi:restriction endonuclease [Sphingobacterium daejeonense]|uniref:restriction endonuclease n=1 Tax=Sphingobacterium daejeonense TaxID=371142 RepID=UPI0010C3EBFB|nr:restriction endonuclease [Sphingobacterium daejeonense]VTP98814.1 EcoKMrr [Sphingobacterium daejeonense]
MSENFKKLHVINRSEEYLKNYQVRYVAEISHLGLNTYRVLKDKESWILDNKIDNQFKKWDEQWSKIILKNNVQTTKIANQKLAEEKTREAQEALLQIENILFQTLTVDDAIDWNSLKNKKKFTESNPQNLLEKELKKLVVPKKKGYKKLPKEPNKADFQPKFNFFDKILKSVKQQKILKSEKKYHEAMDNWNKEIQQIENINTTIDKDYTILLEKHLKSEELLLKKFNSLEIEWLKSKDEFNNKQKVHNLKIEKLKEQYFQKEENAIIEYCELVLNNSQYPDTFPKDFDLEYKSESDLLIIDFVLPSPSDFPKLSEVKYIATKKEIKEYYISELQLAKMYDTAIYNICLRTLHEIFEADKAIAIDIIVFNGWVETINRANGKKINSCIVSLQAKKEEFNQIDLSHVDPKACFKSLKGVGSSKLHSITSIKPLIQINRNDKRFVDSYDIAHMLDEGYNLAIMSWEDFEHLIRELFQKEFSTNGGEVKVTRASRDGGVDAVAFDPDPIRGGKIVIQAKRYTNTVGVSAVRDLYGTVLNEGATKGILVSTADYGPDAYEFAKNKPLTLLNGNNLLYLLEKHGQKAFIDLKEAKKYNLEQKNK